jgi:hypothetical protein
LCVLRRLHALHAPLALTGGLVGVFRTVVQRTVLTVLAPREKLALRQIF